MLTNVVETYSEVGPRTLTYAPPEELYDEWGWHKERGTLWCFYFCVMDDYGTAVPRGDWPTHYHGYVPYLHPEMSDDFEEERNVLFVPTCH